MSGLLFVAIIAAAGVSGLAWMVFRIMVSKKAAQWGAARVEERMASTVRVAPADNSLGPRSRIRTPSTGGSSAFGRIHLGPLHRHDGHFSEMAFLEQASEWHRAAHMGGEAPLSDAARHTLGAMPDQEITGLIAHRPEVVGAYADELWSNVQLRFQALLELPDGSRVARDDTWKLRRKHDRDWSVVMLADVRRVLTLPLPPALPLGPVGPAVHPAPDLDTHWPALEGEAASLRESAAALVEGLLNGSPESWPLFEAALAWDRALLKAEGVQRTIEVESVHIGGPLRAGVDSAHTVVEFEGIARLTAGLRREGFEAPPATPATQHFAVTVARDAQGATRLLDFRWTEESEAPA